MMLKEVHRMNLEVEVVHCTSFRVQRPLTVAVHKSHLEDHNFHWVSLVVRKSSKVALEVHMKDQGV